MVYVSGTKKETEFNEYQILAMDVNHDSYINDGMSLKNFKMADSGVILAQSSESSIEQSCYAISKEQLKIINQINVIEEAKEKLKARVQGTSYVFSDNIEDGTIISGINQGTTTVNKLKQILGNEFYVIKRNNVLENSDVIGKNATLAVKDESGSLVEVATLE